MRPYWTRLVAGIVLGCVCGLTASAFIWATRTLADRLEAPKTAPTEELEGEKRKPPMFPEWDARLKNWKQRVNTAIDPWLPRSGFNLDWKRVVGCLLLLPLLGLVRGMTDYASNYCMGWVSERVINDLRCDVLAKLTSLSLDYFNRSTTGDMLTRINADTMNLHRAMRQGTADMVKEIFTMISVLGFLVFMDWKLTLFVLVFMPLIILPLFVLGKKARRASREGRKANVGQNSLLIEALTGIRVLKAFNLEKRQIERFRDFSKC